MDGKVRLHLDQGRYAHTDPAGQTAFMASAPGPSSRPGPGPSRPPARGDRPKCGYCGKPGHTADVCRKREREQTQNMPRQPAPAKPAGAQQNMRAYHAPKPGNPPEHCDFCNDGSHPGNI
jgi:hypothetical protein